MDIVDITFELENSAALITLSYSNTAQIKLNDFTKSNKMHLICFFSVNSNEFIIFGLPSLFVPRKTLEIREFEILRKTASSVYLVLKYPSVY